RHAEFYLGEDKFQTAVRAFLKKHEYANATWQDLVSEFESASGRDLKDWAANWVQKRSLPLVVQCSRIGNIEHYGLKEVNKLGEDALWQLKFKVLMIGPSGQSLEKTVEIKPKPKNLRGRFDFYCDNGVELYSSPPSGGPDDPSWFVDAILPNYQDYGYGIFLLDDKSCDYVLKNIQNEKDDFLRSMMWGALWDSVREAELDPREYVELAIKNLPTEKDETITASVLGRVSTAMTYYLSEPPAVAGGLTRPLSDSKVLSGNLQPPAIAGGSDKSDLQSRLEAILIERMRTAPTLGQRVTYYRAFLNIVSTENGRNVLKEMLRTGGNLSSSKALERTTPSTTKQPTPLLRKEGSSAATIPLKSKDRFDIVTRLAILSDTDAAGLLADLEKKETSDDGKRYAYAAHAAFATKENKEQFWNDFVNNKDISESWIEAAMVPFNSPRHADLSLPYLERALAELPDLKRNRKIFFVNGWLGSFIGGQKSQKALDTVNKFLADNPNLDKDLRLKILENVDVIERSVKIREKFGN
ncbi:MAG TPA: M1 family metallopeptidase, partial [Pyrinomonadaceae bacterium]|nr:M1 family metallopeptidase [Pyrinomonadaceae bacterium]